MAAALLKSFGLPMPFSGLHRVEVRNAFALMVFRKDYTEIQADAAWSAVLSRVHSGALKSVNPDWESVLRRTKMLSANHTATMGTRSLDILHVAIAKSLRSRTFCSFDKRQRTLAASLGMQLEPPVL
jgi:predicted nucleic acid-binding protein